MENEKYFSELLDKLSWKDGKSFSEEIYNTLKWDERIKELFNNLKKYLKNQWFSWAVNVEEKGELEKFIRKYFKCYDPEFNIREEGIKLYINTIREWYLELWIKQFNPLKKEDFFRFYSLFSSAFQQELMRNKFVYQIFKELPNEDLQTINQKERTFEGLIKEWKSNEHFKIALNKIITKIFQETGGVPHRFGTAEVMIKENLHIEEPNVNQITRLVEMGFNSYMKELLWAKLPYIKFTTMLPEELNKEEATLQDLAIYNYFKKAFPFLTKERPN